MSVNEAQEERTRTPIGATQIVLNPKISDEAIPLACPECGEEIECWRGPEDELFEYRCDCDKLQKFKIRGAGDE